MGESEVDLGIDGLGAGTRIGEGGSAVVYRARQEELDRDVAVKVLGVAADADTVRRFDRERRLMGRLSRHEGIVTVLETGLNARGEPYIVMPLLDGSLDDEIKVEPMAWERAVEIIVDVCRTVGFAHGEGIVHRDLKPANIMMSTGGRPLVADFGIARIVDTNTNLEATTLALTPAYSPPEAFDTTVAQPTGDVYSLGATLYALIMAHPPYSHRDQPSALLALMYSIVNDPVPDLGSRAPASVQDVLERAMAKRPEDRYPTVNDLGDALDAARASALAARESDTVRVTPTLAPSGPGPDRRPFLAVAALVAVAVVVGGLWSLTRPGARDRDAASTSAPTSGAEPSTVGNAAIPSSSASPSPEPVADSAPVTSEPSAITSTIAPSPEAPIEDDGGDVVLANQLEQAGFYYLSDSTIIDVGSWVVNADSESPPDASGTDYGPANLIDDDLDTAWQEGIRGRDELGVGSELSIEFVGSLTNDTAAFEIIDVYPGWHSQQPCLYERHARPTEVRVDAHAAPRPEFGDLFVPIHTVFSQPLELDNERSLLRIQVPATTYSKVVLTVTEVDGGVPCGGQPAFDDMLVSEVQFADFEVCSSVVPPFEADQVAAYEEDRYPGFAHSYFPEGHDPGDIGC